MSDYISKEEVIHSITKVELKDGTFAEVKIEIGKIQPISVTEIVRKTVERIVERLEEKRDESMYQHKFDDYFDGIIDSITIVREEGGVE